MRRKPKLIGGEVRFRRRFLWWPVDFNGDWRWLEYANVRETYCWVMSRWEIHEFMPDDHHRKEESDNDHEKAGDR